ncbi:hypothetical protein ARAM_005099 [Aspergillus rambellii]|uniref:Zn(2)-C6 fungal-type domain-containing protein n=1 Tax=Aspergillus rambellii TaxID=308745 RepID=A0A0F8UN27_9EURO|nr:hypothetical protein ARAM_005099 [Aspergillus rambellii]
MDPPSDHRSLGPRAKLTCEMCKRRKVKCDKLHPCTNCRKSNVICVPVERPRLPRGRSGRTRLVKDAREDYGIDLRDRVAMLEQLVEHLLGSRAAVRGSTSLKLVDEMGCIPSSSHAPGNTSITTTRAQAPPEGVNSDYSQFTEFLTGKHDSILRPLQAIQVDSPLNNRLWGQTAGEGRISHASLASGDSKSNFDLLNGRLLQIFVDQVDPIFPFLPCTALRLYLTMSKPYLHYSLDHPAPSALALAVSYMTVSSMSSDQCSRTLGIHRQVLLEKYHKHTQSALEKVDYLNTEDLTVLQAFVLFLLNVDTLPVQLSIRAHEQSRKAWTMLSLVLRIAQSLFLSESDPPFPVSPLEREMRRRLWHVITLLDVQASFDHGSEPMLRWDCLISQTFSPVHCLGYLVPPRLDAESEPLSASFTDPMFMTIMGEAQNTFRALALPGLMDIPARDIDIPLRQQIVAVFQQKSLASLTGYHTDTKGFRWFLERMVEITHAFLQLAAVRPVSNPPNLSPSLVPPERLLLMTVEFMQLLYRTYRDEQSEPFRWFMRLFVPWHPLSVAMDEVCICEDLSLQHHYQSLIEQFLLSFQDILTDVHRSLLQKPVGRFKALQQPTVQPFVSDTSSIAVDISSNILIPDGSYFNHNQ